MKLHSIISISQQSAESFGATIESVLVKYGRGIVDEQFILNRLAQAAMDTYTMAAVLSRASFSATQKIPTAEHEILMAQVWCSEVKQVLRFSIDDK